MKTGLRVDTSGFKARFAKLAAVKASDFTAELLDFARKSLTTAIALTPSRDYSLIRAAQLKQYDQRVNCIPDSHTLHDPSLRIKGRVHWLYHGGRWYNASDWKLPDDAWAAYGALLAEHERRADYAQSSFIKDRAKARFLYKQSWAQAGESIGVRIAANADVRGAETRRNPKRNPPRGYAQIRGGGKVKSIVVRNPFLSVPSRYIDFDADEIMRSALSKHEAAYRRAIAKRMRGMRL